MSEETTEMDIFDYYTIMDRASVVLLNFSDIADIATGSPELSAKADALMEQLNDFYQLASDVFDKEVDVLGTGE